MEIRVKTGILSPPTGYRAHGVFLIHVACEEGGPRTLRILEGDQVMCTFELLKDAESVSFFYDPLYPWGHSASQIKSAQVTPLESGRTYTVQLGSVRTYFFTQYGATCLLPKPHEVVTGSTIPIDMIARGGRGATLVVRDTGTQKLYSELKILN